ncbi:uncharacterized protein LOC133725063 isoform X1 [Rosa rugosa]|uniref:uncharacterized protein LOC133725063 isoform X1 n=1 Tax=Rosa rugosa TaxID=74645 RepID=UPI002B410A4A|nr:uncharacterized protein LOC133725063 isoform X1 [Rosa rugosa]
MLPDARLGSCSLDCIGSAYLISEGSLNSPEAPASIGTQDATNSEISNRKPRGKAKALDKGKVIEPVEVEFNERSQPYGKHAARFATFLGVTARELVPLTIPSWTGKALSDEFKTEIWKHITTYYIVDECHKKVIFQRMSKLWRDHRSLTLKEVMKQAELVGLQTAAAMCKPDNIHSMDEWLSFIKSRMTPAFMEKCEKFRRMRERKTLLHRTSRKSFACIEDELKQKSDKPDSITRCDVWLHAYEAKKKDSSEDVEDPEVVKQVKQNMAEQVTSQTHSVNDDAVSKVLGPDRRGRVRGYGFGALPSKVDGQTFVGNKVTMLENALSATSRELQGLKMMVKYLLARSDEGEKKNETSSSAQHSATESAESKKINTTIRSSNNDRAESKKRKLKDGRVGGSEQETSKKSKQKTHASIQSTAKEKEGGSEVMFVPSMKKLHLLSWLDKDEKLVATADLHSEDPNEKVHSVPLGPGCWKVWVREVSHDIALFRPTQEFCTLAAAKGSPVAWPINFIKLL